MALDWNKEISLSTITGLFNRGGGGSAGSSAYPTKTTMNLYQGSQKSTDVRKVVVAGVLMAIAIVLFVKFGVLDQLARVSAKEGELAEQRSLAAGLTGSMEDYDQVKEMYEAYVARYGDGATDAIGILDMVEKVVMSKTQVSAIVLADDTLTLTLYDVALDTVGNLAKELEGQPMVESVNVTTATTQNAEGQNTVSTLVIGLVGSEGEEE